jgi:hypothetical protein
MELGAEDDSLFTGEETAILDLYYVPVYLQRSLITDDSFKFS